MNLENHFAKFRKNVIGHDAKFQSPYGMQKIIYADWIASGRLYLPIEQKMQNKFGPFVANTHTETNETGTRMTHAYHYAQKFIKKQVNANSNDVIIAAGSGMTSVINKFQRILGLKTCGLISNGKCIQEQDKPVVFISHMEHHSNHTSWYSTNAEVVQIKPDKNLLIDYNDLKKQLKKYANRKFKIGSFTACSNVTGVKTNYHKLAKIMHEHGGVCFIDFAASAPYEKIDMHPKNSLEKLDAIFFSPHKFLGGPGTSGILIFNSEMYKSEIPDNPGGGTVKWTNPWGEYKFIDDIEVREDGGSPPFLQVIRVALAFELKKQMGTENIKKREKELLEICFTELDKINGLKILANNVRDRLGVISFFHHDVHYNLFVKLLNDKYGIQVRGGCACAGAYGHYLLEVTHDMSHRIAEKINSGDLSEKPGWVRLSIHPLMTNEEIKYILNAIKEIVETHQKLQEDYIYDKKTNEFYHKSINLADKNNIEDWFVLN